MSTQVKEWLDFVIQQMVAESYLDQTAELPGGLVDVLRLGNNNSRYLQRDTRPDTPNLPGATRLTDSQIKYFNDTFDIIDHRSDNDPRFTGITGGNGAGFSATLMHNRTTDEYTLSFRSLEYADQKVGGDWERDGAFGAAGEIKDRGFALAQIAAIPARPSERH